MASPRITKSMVANIVANTIAHQFGKEIKRLAKQEYALAQRVYDEQFNAATQAQMNALGAKFFDRDPYVKCNAGGKTIRLSFGSKPEHSVVNSFTNAVGYYSCNAVQEALFPSEERVWKTTPHSYMNNNWPIAKPKLIADIDAYLDSVEETKQELGAAQRQLTALLESVTTFKKLRAVWPEGEKFYDMYDVDHVVAGVPAVVVTDLNKALGL